jgi:cytochrome P450
MTTQAAAATQHGSTDLFTNPDRFADMEGWRAEARDLHAKGPVHRIEVDGFDPIWAVIGHDELKTIERRHQQFTNAPKSVLADRQERREHQQSVRTLVELDEPDHAKYRNLTADWFKPASIKRMAARLEELSVQALERLEESGGAVDFYEDVARSYPLQVILAILGLPEDDYPLVFRLTQELFGGQDPDVTSQASSDEARMDLMGRFTEYFGALIADRQASPRDDLATLIANAEIDGVPMPQADKVGYFIIVATAGHDTTAAAMSGGLRALAEHPDQLDHIRENPELIPNAVEEMLRWTSPVRHFMRTSRGTNEVAGVEMHDGDWVYLSYLGANLDPRVFDDPLRFDVTRANAGQNVAFGHGVHFCLGAQLARMELRSLFSHLVPRLASLRLAGPAPTTRSTFVGGQKALPIAYELT